MPWCTDCEFSTADVEVIYIEGAVTTYNISLSAGWNLISIPVRPQDRSIGAVLESIEGKYSKVFTYDNGWEYKAKVDGTWYGSLNEMDIGIGYWVYMDEKATLTVTGEEVGANIDLNGGWSLIGYPSTTPRSISSALLSIDNNYDRIFTYNAGSGWEYMALYDGTWYGTLTEMSPGKGYWVHTTNGGGTLSIT